MKSLKNSVWENNTGNNDCFEIVVIGGGHAGCEAALAASRLGCRTVMFTMNLDSIANMPCNPNIGGTAKGHLVREIDALGGEMGKIADKTFIQSRILNASKGPAVYSLRAQIDRAAYKTEMKSVLENSDNLIIKQGEIIEILFDGNRVVGVTTKTEAHISCKAVIITTGTYLCGKIIIGDISYSGGPDGMFAADKLSECLKNKGIRMHRLKTGTPARVSGKTVNTNNLEILSGDSYVTPFSFENEEIFEAGNKGEKLPAGYSLDDMNAQIDCWLTHTNERTHKIIRDNLHRAPMFSGLIEGVGPRYCPSIEDKIVRFADKERHQIFIEPMGPNTMEYYLGGMSTGMPEDVQTEMIRSVKGLEEAEVMRSAYAIEYDAIDSTQLNLSLEIKNFAGLYSAGQINGTSGYEEAAAQGLIAGINAARMLRGEKPVIPDRSLAYIGVMIDDIVTKGTDEPYRMMTSRAEYRLLLRQDNADERLTEQGYRIGLISEKRYECFLQKRRVTDEEIDKAEKTYISPGKEINNLLISKGSSPIETGCSFADLLRRPGISYEDIKPFDIEKNMRDDIPFYFKKIIETKIKYAGYIKRQLQQVDQYKKAERKLIPEDMDYSAIDGLRIEAKQKLNKIKPVSVGQAGRISGVTPADIAVLVVAVERYNRRKDG